MKPFETRSLGWWRPVALRSAYLLLVCALAGLVLSTASHGATVTRGAMRSTLENGLTVVLKPDRSAPVAAIQVWVRTGSANETEAEAGITHFIEHMIFKGTPTRKTGQIARTIESSGGNINAYTTLDRTVYYVEIPSAHFDTGLDVLLDAIQNSLFDPKELEREREVVLEEYRRSLDMPQRRLSRSVMRLCYQKHPYGRPVIGHESTIRSFDRKAILRYMGKWYTPENMVLVAVGDFNIEEALKSIKSRTEAFPKRSGKRPTRAVEPPQTALRHKVIYGNVKQLYLDMSWRIPPVTHDHIPALDLLEIILGHGKSSRLYKALKTGKNMVHSIDASAYGLLDPGLFSIDGTLRPENLDPALAVIAREVSTLARVPVSPSELDKAKKVAQANFLFAMEKMSGMARSLAFFETMTGDMHQIDTYLQRIKQVTAKELVQVAHTYLQPTALSIGILAPRNARINLSSQQVLKAFSPAAATTDSEAKDPLRSKVEAVKITLQNGMRLIVKENTRIPVVSVTGVFLGGIRLEDRKSWGISSFVAEMLTRGTKDRSAAEIAAAVESRAGFLQGFSGNNSLGISGKFLSKDLRSGLELISDVLLNPTFPAHEMENVRQDMLAAIRAKQDRPTPQLFDLFYRTLFKHHPYGHPRTGTEDTIQSMQQSDLEQWYRSLAVPSNLVMAVVGDVKKTQILPLVKKLFGDFRPSSKGLPPILPEPPLEGPRRAHMERQGAQTHLIIGYLGVGLKSKDNAAMALIETALSGQGGRLFLQLRDKESLAYSVTAFRRPGLETGLFGVYIACHPTKLAPARAGIFRELERLKQQGISQSELTAAKKYLMGNLQIDLQTNRSQAMHMALDELYGLGYGHIHDFIRAVEAVTEDDIKRVARKIIRPRGFVQVTTGPHRTSQKKRGSI